MDNSDRKHHSPDDYDSMDGKKTESSHSDGNSTQKELDDENIPDESTTQQELNEAEEEQIIIDDVVAFLTRNRHRDVEPADAANESNSIPSSEDEDESNNEENHADKEPDNFNNDDETNLTQERMRLLKLQKHTMERLKRITEGIIQGYKTSDTA